MPHAIDRADLVMTVWILSLLCLFLAAGVLIAMRRIRHLEWLDKEARRLDPRRNRGVETYGSSSRIGPRP